MLANNRDGMYSSIRRLRPWGRETRQTIFNSGPPGAHSLVKDIVGKSQPLTIREGKAYAGPECTHEQWGRIEHAGVYSWDDLALIWRFRHRCELLGLRFRRAGTASGETTRKEYSGLS